MRTKTDFSEKPYNRCLTCQHRKVRCDGPRTSSMELSRWCEFMRDMKEANGLTNADIAEKTGISIKTIERLMAQNCEQDIMRETARRIEDAIIGSSSQYPCILAYEESLPIENIKLHDALKDLEHALADNRDIRAELDGIHASYKAEMQIIRDEAKERIDQLIAQVNYLRIENDRKAKIIDKFLDK